MVNGHNDTKFARLKEESRKGMRCHRVKIVSRLGIFRITVTKCLYVWNAMKNKTEDCQKPKKSKAKFIRCGKAHPANWQGCSAHNKKEERANSIKVSAVQHIETV